MAPRVLLVMYLIAVVSFVADARAQSSPSSGTTQSAATPSSAPASKAATLEAKQQARAAKKAERIAIRKKRAQCYDEAKTQKLGGQDLVRYLETCNKK